MKNDYNTITSSGTYNAKKRPRLSASHHTLSAIASSATKESGSSNEESSLSISFKKMVALPINAISNNNKKKNINDNPNNDINDYNSRSDMNRKLRSLSIIDHDAFNDTSMLAIFRFDLTMDV